MKARKFIAKMLMNNHLADSKKWPVRYAGKIPQN